MTRLQNTTKSTLFGALPTTRLRSGHPQPRSRPGLGIGRNPPRFQPACTAGEAVDPGRAPALVLAPAEQSRQPFGQQWRRIGRIASIRIAAVALGRAALADR